MKQRDAVYNAVTSVLSDSKIHFEDGMNAQESLTDSGRSAVQAIVVQAFKSKTVEFEDTPSNQAKMASDAKLNTYVSGLISNWLRKDTRLNGNTKYTAKNPGSRAGASDPTLKALRQLAVQFKSDEKKLAQIQNQINVRAAALNAEKAKKITVDISVLSPELIAELGLN